MIEIKNLTKKFNDHLILDDISFNISFGSVNCLIGPSGSGKTTFIRTIASLDKISSGEIFLNNDKINDITHKDIGFVFQNFYLFENMTAKENLLYTPLKIRKTNENLVMNLYNSLIKNLNIQNILTKYPSQLSGGQKQRIALARALILQPKIMLLDEPTSALDPENIYQIKEEISLMKKNNITVIIVSHDIHFVKDIADNVMFLKDGKILDYCEKNLFFDKYKNENTNDISFFLKRVLY